MNNKMKITFSALSENEAFARTAVAGFVMSLDPTVEQITDIKTAVSEAVTNCVVHGYPDKGGEILLECEIVSGVLHITISDFGVGISNLSQVLEPFYTSKPLEERAGMGFTIMRTFMDSFEVESSANNGTVVKMSKTLKIA
ncbi:MAG: anti-sigma F factor [Clostridia bacterium]|nr:anti-sigma F factor [Clostridia bacterium]